MVLQYVIFPTTIQKITVEVSIKREEKMSDKILDATRLSVVDKYTVYTPAA